MNSTDITLEYYYKKAIYVSPITGCRINIDFKRVEETNHRFDGELITDVYILSTNGVFYHEKQLTDFGI